MRVPRHGTGVLLMIVAACLWSVAGVATRFIESAGRWEVACLRSMFAALSMLVLIGFIYRGEAFATFVRGGRAGIASGFTWALQFTCFMLALSYTTVANTLIVESLAPLLTSAMAFLFLGLRVTRRTWAMATLSLAGIVLMFGASSNPSHLLGNLIALAVPIGAGLTWVIAHKFRGQVDLTPAVFTGAVISALAMLPLALPFTASARDIAILAGLGMFQLAVPCVLAMVAARVLSPTEMTLFLIVEIVLGSTWAWLGAGERPPLLAIVGGLIAIAALVTETLASSREHAAARAVGPPSAQG